MHYE